MQKTRLWNLYITAYTVPIGLILLCFPHRFPFIHFAPADDPWVRFSGGIFVALGYLNVVAFREQLMPVMQAFFICQAVFAIIVSVIAPFRESRILYGIAAVLIVGALGSTLTYFIERSSYVPEPIQQKPRMKIWNLYVASYTLFFGVAPVIFPGPIAALLGFERPEGLWIVFSGLGFLTLSLINVITYVQQGPPSMMLAILAVRIWFLVMLVTMTLVGYPLRIYLIVAIVLFGVIGTIRAYRAGET
jgi:hypothetical protein